MLRLIKTGTGDAPAFFCDHCEQRIEDITLALYSWKQLDTFRWDETGEFEFVISPNHPSVLVDRGQIYVLHKACIDQFEAEHEGDTYDWPCLELIDLVVFLIHNGGLTVKDVQERVDFVKNMGYNEEDFHF